LIYSISLNGLQRYADSNEVFQLAKKAGSKDKSIDIWINKNNGQLAKGKEAIAHEVIVVSEEEKASNIDAVPKELHYSIERIKFASSLLIDSQAARDGRSER